MRRLWGGLAIAVALVVPTAACGDDSDDESSAVCDARASLAASVDALRDVDVVSNGLAAFQTAVTAVRDDLAALRDAAREDLADEFDAVRTELDDLQDAIAGAADAPSISDAATGIREAVAQLRTAGSALATKLESRCE